MNVDNALRELGMLSAVTDSRKQFLLEKNKQKESKQSSSNYQVVCMNSTFVTGIGPIKYIANEEIVKDDEIKKSPSRLRMESQENIGKATRERRFRKHYIKPYYHTKRSDVNMDTGDDNTFIENGNHENLSCLRSMRRKRSKSLDDIKFVKEVVQQKNEVEKVAKVMQNLTVK